ncbi:hypothetical protein [Mucilaginibacter lappiensis]|uniref:Uncharacterized protein n=1 Tax=Mucilaginibacter lappiensis TaxID=354630 RepID=A0A841JPJ7_9SPHI|nr:hypothetical protein [Mucilaginibacter lappiensis]MBB6131526.1 hypothetical protein [Mucilaginibacter lappiensis]
MCIINSKKPIRASQEEILFLRKHAPKGLWKMVEFRTKRTKAQVLYQIMQMPENQDLLIIQAVREILFVVTGLVYEKQ